MHQFKCPSEPWEGAIAHIQHPLSHTLGQPPTSLIKGSLVKGLRVRDPKELPV